MVLLASCSQRAPIDACTDNLNGIYAVEDHADQQWSILDPPRGSLEAYPLFDDGHDPLAPNNLEVAPRRIELQRDPAGLSGRVRRRYLQHATVCSSAAPVTITSCHANTLDVVLGGPVPPTSFAPCTFGRALPARLERWHLLRR